MIFRNGFEIVSKNGLWADVKAICRDVIKICFIIWGAIMFIMPFFMP
nr:MAG TPA: hypothetical protein [Caudoviricetes sp.]